MEKLKKAGKFLFSMRFALILLALLIAVCVVGSLIPQGESDSYYRVNYPEKTAMLILLLDLNNVFRSVWFITLSAFLCVNLLGCNIVHFPRLMSAMKKPFAPADAKRFTALEPDIAGCQEPETLFRKLGFPSLSNGRDENGREYIHAIRHRAGMWGAWLTHLAMLVIILGFSLGQIYTEKYTMYGVPGTEHPVGDTRYTMRIDDFAVNLRPDETVEQYVADITVTDTVSGTVAAGRTSVNHPASLLGMKYYQNSTGWAARVLVFEKDELIQDEILCAGEYIPIATKPDLIVAFSAFYPDYVKGANGMPATRSPYLNHPAYLYTVYYREQILGMNILEDDYITIDDYTIGFAEPQQYTLIQAKRDPFTPIALVGAVLLCIAVFLAFYYRTEELFAIRTEECVWNVYAYSKKGGLLFKDRLQEKYSEIE